MLDIGKDRIEDLFELSTGLSIATKQQHVSAYDFDFRKYFQVKTILGDTESNLILRIGAVHDYPKVYHFFAGMGLRLINTIEAHNQISLLPNWYLKIPELTPRSRVFETPPSYDQVKEDFTFPVFIKGERQTHKHKKELCFAEDRNDFERISNFWRLDPILNWQKMIVRDFVPLMPIESAIENQLNKSFEVRAFVWHGTLLSIGQYWESHHKIKLTIEDEDKINALIQTVYQRIPAPFMVIDFGKTIDNEWIIIELNDAQESGYAMNAKINLWSKIMTLGTT